MGKLNGSSILILFLLLYAFPQELAAQDFFARVLRTGPYNRYSCGKMEAYNQRSAYRKHKRSFLKKMIARRTPKSVEKDKIAQSKPPGRKTTPPQNKITATSKTRGPSTKPPVGEPVGGTEKEPPVAKVPPLIPKKADSSILALKPPPLKLTRQELKKMTIEERRDTLQKIQPEIALPPIQFISDQDEFSVVNMDSFMQAMEYAKQGKVVLIEGHTDDLGSDAYNLKLSMKRAEKIRQILLSGEVGDELISVIGYGERQPLVPNNSDANRSINRRIEFKIFSLPE